MSREFFRKVADKQHIKLTYITHFYCNQQDISEVVSLLREYETMPASVLDYVQFVIVDDCSPLEYEIPEFNLNLTWLRITTDIPWNQGGSRNLGVTYAASDKILMTDLDHVLPVSTFTYLINAANPGGHSINSTAWTSRTISAKGIPICSLCPVPVFSAFTVMMKNFAAITAQKITAL